MDHSILRPSAAERWLKCYASPILESEYPDKQTSYSSEGIVAHSLAEMSVRTDTSPDRFVDKKIQGLDINLDMALAVSIYYQHINQLKNHFLIYQIRLVILGKELQK